jgi:hypothetical protein
MKESLGIVLALALSLSLYTAALFVVLNGAGRMM